MVKQTTAQNAYFDALKTMAQTGSNNHRIDRLLDEMFSEYRHNRIGEEYNVESELLKIIENRFIGITKDNSHYLRDHIRNFEIIKEKHKPLLPHLDIFKLIANADDRVNPQSESEPSTEKSDTKKLTNKPKFIILKELGFFDLPKLEKLTTEKKGELLSKLLDMNYDNATDYVGNIYDRKGDSGNKSPYNKYSIREANRILCLIDLPPI